MNDVSFIIQGPYNPAHLTMIHDLKKQGKVILTCYNTDYDKIVDPKLYDVIILNDQIDAAKHNIYNFENIYYQVRTTKRALSIVDTEYVVKFRSDSFYSGIPYIVESIKNNPDKLSTTPLNINPDWPYQFCDHVMGSTTNNLKRTFEEAESIILSRNFIYEGIDTRMCPVILLFTSWLKSKGFKSGEFAFEFYVNGNPQTEPRMQFTNGSVAVTVYKDYYETITSNVNILNIRNMEPFFAKSNTMKKSFSKAEDFPITDMDTYIKIFEERLGQYSTLFKKYIK